MILIVSTEEDLHARAVRRELVALGRDALLLDLADFPQRLALSWRFAPGGRSFALREAGGRSLDLGAVGAVWWRRPQPYALHPELADPEHRKFAYAEAYEAFTGMWQALDPFWINPPARDEAAHRKVFQLRTAQNVGLEIPETLVTSDPEAARGFVERLGFGRCVYKAFSATPTLWRETRLVRAEEMALLDNVRYAPVIFQEYVEAAHDLRITVVGDEIFAAEVHSQETAYKIDMRMDIANARIAPAELPLEVRDRLIDLMRRLGLIYGAIDMRRTPDGRHVFLEINPAGQWLFIEERTGQTIAAALARLLATQGFQR